MLDGISLICPTRNRKHNFSLLEKWIARQTSPLPKQFLVINDGSEVYSYSRGQQVILRDPIEEREWRTGPLLHSLNWNLLAALPHVMFGKICIMEDDDWYHPQFLDRMDYELEQSELVGFFPPHYWNISTNEAAVMRDCSSTALACTGFRASLIPLFKSVCERGDPFIDVNFWQAHEGSMSMIRDVAPGGLLYHLAIKGCGTMKGRQKGSAGIGVGHAPSMGGFGFPASHRLIKTWIGDDIEEYL